MEDAIKQCGKLFKLIHFYTNIEIDNVEVCRGRVEDIAHDMSHRQVLIIFNNTI